MGVSVDRLEELAAGVLAANDRGSHIAPALPNYPEQWLWDSAYAAIGLSHRNPDRAAGEIESLLSAQWATGMVPHMIFRGDLGAGGWRTRLAIRTWSAHHCVAAPAQVLTSGITQPPVLAEAVARVVARLGSDDRCAFLARTLPSLARYHAWFYRERDLAGNGLVAAIHPWETGMDNTPPWIDFLRRDQPSWLVRAAQTPLGQRVADLLRADMKESGHSERIKTEDGLRLLGQMQRLRRLRFEPRRMWAAGVPAIEDVGINSILIRNNEILRNLAVDSGLALDDELLNDMQRTAAALNLLWDEEAGLFFSRNARTGELFRAPTSASLLALYGGALTAAQRARLIEHLNAEASFAPAYPVPSVPVNDTHFEEMRFWRGPTWVNVNWHLIDGARRAGELELAARLRETTLSMIARSGFYEYFSPLDGRGIGAKDFSWTAALTIDLLNGHEWRSR